MTDLDETTGPVDGRVARRQRNIDVVLDAVLEMFAEEAMFPTIEQAATRSGLSLRSLYRYFADPGELLEAAIKRSDQIAVGLSRLHAVGRGPLEDRIEDFVTMRLKLYDGIGPVYRATLANAARLPRVRDELAKNRNAMREQFELQFGTELAGLKSAERDAAITAGDLLTQLESIDYLRRHRQLSVGEARAALRAALLALLR
ncbi:MAG: TetR/AcrR family transcriptional regulator [Actinobacteria bacterium]|nr:TetR/AcrR family transcriptional regulator [Actinomycetota bacterium]NIS33137.1 TetR/AcrR family transcriptional regulator [Actinomycetota bacterium]NIT94515.1 TetR/AcrR family transcriptional regulator [Actinomycetota bacterium]NIU18123.1 TetR/AcrR family transcriptional regulator [Actinomycetota bacterium]NIU64769.1 TetR/AcrR family transcriptional regulator [Actinomycetota bacterium]